MNWNFPSTTETSKQIPKNTLYQQGKVSTKLRQEFIQAIESIIWTHTLSEKTFSVPNTAQVEEIQIFSIQLKTPQIPRQAIKYIDTKVPYPILFEISHQDNTCLAISAKVIGMNEMYYTTWNQDQDITFQGHTLEAIYEGLVRTIIGVPDATNQPLPQIINQDIARRKILREITSIKSKIRKATQFKEQVELNMKLRELEGELEDIR